MSKITYHHVSMETAFNSQEIWHYLQKLRFKNWEMSRIHQRWFQGIGNINDSVIYARGSRKAIRSVMYCQHSTRWGSPTKTLNVYVNPRYRHQGLATGMLQSARERYPSYYFEVYRWDDMSSRFWDSHEGLLSPSSMRLPNGSDNCSDSYLSHDNVSAKLDGFTFTDFASEGFYGENSP